MLCEKSSGLTLENVCTGLQPCRTNGLEFNAAQVEEMTTQLEEMTKQLDDLHTFKVSQHFISGWVCIVCALRPGGGGG